MNLKYKLGIILGIFVFLILATIGVTFWTVNSQKDDALIINMAGRQRMLAQKFSKEFFNGMIPSQAMSGSLKAAEIVTLQIKEDRAKYTTSVIGKLKRELKGFRPSRDWTKIKGGVPLPATFVQEVSDKINQTGVYRYDLLSRWNINKQKGLADSFENEAFDFISKYKDKPYYRFMKHMDKFVLRYATADVASSQTCVKCHNSHPDSAKRDFKLGDVMGVLIVTIPITEEINIGEAMFTANNGDDDVKKPYEATKMVFEKTMDALFSGGDVPVDFSMTKFVNIPPVKDEAIGVQLKVANELWGKMMRHVKVIESSEINSPKYLAEFVSLQDTNLKVTSEMNKAVGMYEAASRRKIANMKKMLIFFLLLALGAAAVGWSVVIRYIVRPVISVVEVAEDIADGNLSVQGIDVNGRDEMGKLAGALNKMKDSLNDIIGKIRESSSYVASAATELSATSTQIAHGTDKQSDQTNEVASAMEQMSASVGEVAKNSLSAADYAVNTQEIAVKGGEVVKKAVDGMMNVAATVKASAATIEILSKSSDQISAIIDVINSIADQTNLLALNAAIEAARAGEQGRGFAVVADEVRKLAEKTTGATKEITDMIGTIQKDTHGAMNSMREGTKQVEEGVQLATEAGDALGQIVESVEKVTGMVRHIATASEQQRFTTKEITSNITSITGIARESASGVKEMSVATDDLSRVAEELKNMVGAFKLKDGSNGHRGIFYDKYSGQYTTY